MTARSTFIRRFFAVSVLSFLMAALIAPAALASSHNNGGGHGGNQGQSPQQECDSHDVLTKFDSLGAGWSVTDTMGPQDGVTVTVTAVNNQGEILEASWVSTTPVTRVVLKAGLSGGTTDLNFAKSGTLEANQGFSHITFCTGDPDPADLTVAKVVTGNDQPAPDTKFVFSVACGTDTISGIELAAGESWNWNDDPNKGDLVEGVSCTVTETDAKGATATTATYEGGPYTLGTSKVLAAGLDANDFVVTNAFNTIITITPPPDPDPDPDPEPVLVPGIDLVKSANDDTFNVGDTITYTYLITNTGETTLTTVALLDDVLGNLTGELDTRTLEVGESTTVTVTQLVTGDLGSTLTNTAVAAGFGPGHKRVTATDTVTVGITEVAGIIIDAPETEPAPDPEPGPEPAPEPEVVEVEPVAVEELPRTGVETPALVLIALLFLAAGALTLRRPGTQH